MWGISDLYHPFSSYLGSNRTFKALSSPAVHLGRKAWLGRGFRLLQPQRNTVVSEPAMSPSGRRQPAGWTLPALPPLPPPPSFYVLTSTVGWEPGSETEHCAPRSWTLSLLAHQGSQKALILIRGLPVPGLLGLISLAWNLLEQGPHLNQLP